MKTCKTCLETKELTEFYMRSSRLSRREECKVCYTATTMIRHKAKPLSKEQNRKNAARFRAANPTYFHGQYAKIKAKNPSALTAQWANRRAAEKRSTPLWLTKEQKAEIRYIYKNCPKGMHVDHIVPLSGIDVKGLHVPWNLQYLSPRENIIKSNKLESVGY